MKRKRENQGPQVSLPQQSQKKKMKNNWCIPEIDIAVIQNGVELGGGNGSSPIGVNSSGAAARGAVSFPSFVSKQQHPLGLADSDSASTSSCNQPEICSICERSSTQSTELCPYSCCKDCCERMNHEHAGSNASSSTTEEKENNSAAAMKYYASLSPKQQNFASQFGQYYFHSNSTNSMTSFNIPKPDSSNSPFNPSVKQHFGDASPAEKSPNTLNSDIQGGGQEALQYNLYDTIDNQQEIIHGLMKQLAAVTAQKEQLQERVSRYQKEENPFTKHFLSSQIAVCFWRFDKKNRGRRILQACNDAFLKMLCYKGTISSLLDMDDISHLFWFSESSDSAQKENMYNLGQRLLEVNKLGRRKLRTCKRQVPIRDRIYTNNFLLDGDLMYESYTLDVANQFHDGFTFNGDFIERSMTHYGVVESDLLVEVIERARSVLEKMPDL